jgi:hypothetical protein
MPGLVPPALYVTVVAANASGAAVAIAAAVARNDAIARERCFRDGLIDSSDSTAVNGEARP